jgi:hypothetical protein
MRPRLVPYPVPTKRHGVIAARYSQAIEKTGFSALVIDRIREMIQEPASDDVMGRILRNTCIAFSTKQVRSLVISEIIGTTGKRWTSIRKVKK